jgi:D-ornithine 4,5-aminomutase subunit beta
MREILDLKHGGLEKYGFHCHYLGTSVPITKILDAAEETGARAVLISTIITHNDVHRINMQRLHDLAVERGIRDKLLLLAGGTQVTNDIATACGMDAGFGRGSTGHHVAAFLVTKMRASGRE